MKNHPRNGKSAKTQSGVSSTNIQDIPSIILFHIFWRLQISSVLACKTVCKDWCTVISDLFFISNYGVNAPFVYLVNKVNALHRNHFSFMEVSHNGDNVETSIVPKVPDRDSNGSSLSIVDSCNGFFCFEVVNTESISVYVANPVIGECIALPTFHILESTGYPFVNMTYHRFGFSRLTNTLKVVRNSYLKTCITDLFINMLEIFTVGVDTAWRSFEGFRPQWTKDYSVFLNGSFHWITGNIRGDLAIQTFELEEERNGEISHPRGIELQWKRHLLASLGGNLCLLNETVSRITLWTMTEYGVTDSWTRIVIVRLTYPSNVLSWDLRVVSLLENGEYLLINKLEKSLVSYNCEKRKYTKIADFDFSDPLIFTPTLKSFIGDDGAA